MVIIKILVTGGAGFIGSHLLQLLVKCQGIEVVILDNLSSGSPRHVPEGMRLVVEDIRDSKIETLFAKEKFDAVIHLAAQTLVPYSLENPTGDCEINLLGLINVLNCCRRYKVNKVVFSSSAAVYGDNINIPLDENATLLPTSFYGLTKMTSEHYLRLYSTLYGLDTTALRFANVYGERQGEKGEGGVVSIFCKRISSGKGVLVFGDGEQTRDFIYVGDIALAIIKSLALKGFHVINVSTQKETTINQLLEAFRKAIGHDISVTYMASRKGDILHSMLANQRCCELLGFCPSTELMDGIKRTYSDYIKIN